MLINKVFALYTKTNEEDQPWTDRYSVQTGSQVKASGIELLEVHGTDKGLDTHIGPGKQGPLPSLPIHNIDRGQPMHPVPGPRVGQCGARLGGGVRVNWPVLLPQWTPAQLMVTHVPRTALLLPKSVAQSHVQPWHMPILLTQPHQLVNPTHIGPKIQHRPSLPYHDPYIRPPPRPPDITDPLDRWRDLLDNDSDQKIEIEENSPFQEGIILETCERPDTSYVQEPQELKDLIDTTKLIQKFLPKPDRHLQNIRYHKEKGFGEYAFAPYHQGNSSGLPQKSIF